MGIYCLIVKMYRYDSNRFFRIINTSEVIALNYKEYVTDNIMDPFNITGQRIVVWGKYK